MLAYTMPFWAALFAWAMLGERPSRRHMAAFALAAFGLLAVLAPWEGLGPLLRSVLALGGGICRGWGMVFSKILFQRPNVNVVTVTNRQMVLGAQLYVPLPLLWPQILAGGGGEQDGKRDSGD